MNESSNLLTSNVNQNIRDIFAMTFELYKIAELNKNLYKNQDKDLPKKLICLYYDEIKPDYSKMMYNFKKKYIINEAKVEKNDTKLEISGIGLVYDYIQNFDTNEDSFNIFITGLQIHQLLYKPLDDKNREKCEKQLSDAYKMQEEAKKEKNLDKYKKSRELLKELSNNYAAFGGALRNSEVLLNDLDVEVPSADEAKAFYNSYLSKEKCIEYQNMLSNMDIFNYIDYCVDTVTKLIKYQPFGDGNKRTFRSLLNLMFKNRNIPPVYISSHERKQYKNLLINALENDDYEGLHHFYYYKICDSIYELDIKPYLDKRKENKTKKLSLYYNDMRKVFNTKED